MPGISATGLHNTLSLTRYLRSALLFAFVAASLAAAPASAQYLDEYSKNLHMTVFMLTSHVQRASGLHAEWTTLAMRLARSPQSRTLLAQASEHALKALQKISARMDSLPIAIWAYYGNRPAKGFGERVTRQELFKEALSICDAIEAAYELAAAPFSIQPLTDPSLKMRAALLAELMREAIQRGKTVLAGEHIKKLSSARAYIKQHLQ